MYVISHIFLKGHPRSTIILDTTIAITNKQRTLNITVPIISYPRPTVIRWTFIQNGNTEITDVDSTYITTSYGVYQHVSQLIKDDLTDSEYGLFSINVSNNIGPYFQHDFNVVEESKYVLIKYVIKAIYYLLNLKKHIIQLFEAFNTIIVLSIMSSKVHVMFVYLLV